MGHHVPRDDVVDRDAQLLREEAGERAFFGLPESPHRHDVLLPVEHHTSLVHVTVEVDRELRQPEQRPIDFDESHLTTSQRDPSRETEVAVEPRVDERAAVHVDADLAIAGTARVGARLHPQVRAVGVGTDHHEAGARVVGHVPRDDRPAPHDVPAAGTPVERLADALAAEPRRVEEGRRRLRRVIWRRRAREEVEDVGHP